MMLAIYITTYIAASAGMLYSAYRAISVSTMIFALGMGLSVVNLISFTPFAWLLMIIPIVLYFYIIYKEEEHPWLM